MRLHEEGCLSIPDVRVEIDRETGDYHAFRRWTIVPDEEHEEPAHQIALTDAVAENPEAQLGDVIEEPLEAETFGRIGAQAAKQVILQKIRDAEREQPRLVGRPERAQRKPRRTNISGLLM